jgi:hypothetical protein
VNKVDALLLALVGVLAAVAFMNHGNLALSSTPQGASVGVGYRGQ